MVAKSLSILRFPVVALAFLVEQLRHLPGAREVERRAPWVVAVLMVAALAVLAVGMAEQTPQRISIADLVEGKLAPMQSWIIVSGELRAQQVSTTDHRYVLTDPTVPNAVIFVTSQNELPLGVATISGHLVGGTRRAQAGTGWVGQLRADPVITREPDPPWIAIALAAAALFVAVGSRTFYPMFFRQAPRVPAPAAKTMQVGVRRGWPPAAGPVVSGTLEVQRGAPVALRVPTETQLLRLHSPHSSVEVGELRRLFGSEPALVVRPATTEELTVSFASVDERDVAYAALVADVQRPDRVDQRS